MHLCPARFRVLEDAAVLQYPGKYDSDFLLNDAVDVVGTHIRIFLLQFFSPVGMSCDRSLPAYVAAGQEGFFQCFHFPEKTRRKNGEAHHFDQSDIFLLDVMQFRMRMEDSQRILLRRAIVAEHQVQFIPAVAHPCDRGDRIMRHGSLRISPAELPVRGIRPYAGFFV